MTSERFDYIVIGAGFFGLYAAQRLANNGARVAIIDRAENACTAASRVNQARAHRGYHYPRSLDTARTAAQYYGRFLSEFSFAINDSFEKFYAIASEYSKTSADRYISFCDDVGIPIDEIRPDRFFKPGSIEAVFRVNEVGFDFDMIRERLLERLNSIPNTTFFFSTEPVRIDANGDLYEIVLSSDSHISAPTVINATYSGINQILDLVGGEHFKVKYELCEIALCSPSENLKKTGLTVMDGPFFSVMPFGKQPLHSLTTVADTPRATTYDTHPNLTVDIDGTPTKFTYSSQDDLDRMHLRSAWPAMYELFKRYMTDDYTLTYQSSLYTVRPVLFSSEGDDARPTILRLHSDKPTFISIFSGKIDSIFELDNFLDDLESRRL